MKTNKRIALVLFTVGCMLATAASAQVYQNISSLELEGIFKEEGYAYTVTDKGNVKWKIEGWNVVVIRGQGDGKSLRFYTAGKLPKATLSRVNEWNKKANFSRAYLDDDGDPVLELDMEVSGGVTRARVVDFLQTCRASFELWRKHFSE